MYYMKERQSQTFFFDFTISFSPLSRKVKNWNSRQMKLMETADRRLCYFIACWLDKRPTNTAVSCYQTEIRAQLPTLFRCNIRFCHLTFLQQTDACPPFSSTLAPCEEASWSDDTTNEGGGKLIIWEVDGQHKMINRRWIVSEMWEGGWTLSNWATVRAAKIEGKCRFHRNQDHSPTRNRSAPPMEPAEKCQRRYGRWISAKKGL
jgi:hypothetical protein